MTLKLNIYKKDNLTTPIATGDGAIGVNITGLAPGTVVATGDYKASYTDTEGKLLESDKVDVPAFTVLPDKLMIREHVIDKIKSNTEFSKLDDETISECVEEAIKIVKTYDIPQFDIQRAIYLYSCYLLSLKQLYNYWKQINKLV